MPRNDSEGGRSSEAEKTGPSVDRRSYLKVAGVTVGGVGLLSGTASAAERHGLRFQTVVDMVEDAGCDPNGDEPCDEAIRRAADDYTLLKFPAGTYKLTEKNVILDTVNLGFLGEDDTTFSVPEGFNEKALVVDRGTGLLFENIDIDQRATGATPAIHLGADDNLRVHDIELIGQGIHRDSVPKEQRGWSQGTGNENGNPSVMDYFYPIVRSPEGTGLITDLVANNRGLMGAYNAGNGRSGIWVGASNRGTITFRDCRVEEFGSNGCYTSRTYGVVQYEGGVYRNNDNNQIRLGSPDSYVDGATITVDSNSSDAPNPREALNYRGVRVETANVESGTDVEVRNCDISIQSAPHSGGGVVAEATASEFLVKDTRIDIGVNGVRGILGKYPEGGSQSPPPKPYTGTLQNVTITGDASGNAAIELRGRPNSLIDGCQIRESGADRDGVVLIDSDGATVYNSSIDVTGTSVSRRNAPGTDEYGPEKPRSEPGLRWSPSGILTVRSNGDRASYRLTVGANLEKTSTNRATIDDNDTISGNTATGQVDGGGHDSYTFDGGVLSFEIEGDATLSLNGEQIESEQLPDNTLTIASDDGTSGSYRLTVSNELGKSDALRATVDDNDSLTRTHASGQVADGGRDSYGFSGEITSFKYDGTVTAFLNGTEIDSSRLPDNTLSITSKGPKATYRFTAGDNLEKATTNGATIDDNDTINRNTAVGQVDSGGRDTYTFSDAILSFEIDGDATIYLNDEKMTPDEFSDNTLTIASNGGRATYEFTVSTALGKSTGMGATIDDNDTLAGARASGQVGDGGRDSYGYTGEITSFNLEGDATVFINGKKVDSTRLPDNTLTITSTGERAEYDFIVSGNLKQSTVNGATVDDNDSVSMNGASGQVDSGGRDTYTFSGEIQKFSLDGDATIYVNDEKRSLETF